MLVAAYTICLNEMKHIDRWLEATAKADLRVIVDTGSTDGTWRKLVELKDTVENLKVHRIHINPWRFDDARNAALALVPDWVDVCVSVDMDEVPQAGFFETLRKEWKPETTIGWHRINTGPTWEVTRIHKRFGFRWKEICHEVFKPYGGTPEVVQNFDIQIDHLPDDSKSRSQYLDLLEMSVKEDPTNGRMWVYLTREYYFNKKWEKILDAAQEAVECENTWSVERAFACRLASEACYELGLNAEKAVLNGLEFDPDSIEMQHCAAYYYYRIKNWEKTWEHASKRLTLKPTNHYLRVDEVWNWRCHDLMAMAKWNLGDKTKAVEYLNIAIRNCDNDTEKQRLEKNLEFMNVAMSTHK
jgi:glycosyltransferase involved in cell wall biosynthesis